MKLTIEIIGVVLNMAFLFFVLKEKKICWLFGILGSLVSIYLFYITKLYSECILFIYYVIMGFYGFYLWNRTNGDEEVLKISKWSFSRHIKIIILGILFAGLLGYYFDNYSDAQKSYLDAFTTIFSFLATYLEAKKVLSTWVFWIILNGLSIYLYFTRGLNIYSILAAIYFAASFYGYFEWKRKYNELDYDVKYMGD